MSEEKKYGYSVSDLTEFDIAVHNAVCDAVTIREGTKDIMSIPAEDIWILMGNLSKPLTSQIGNKLRESIYKLWDTTIEVRGDGSSAIKAHLLMGSIISRNTGELVNLNLSDEPIVHALRKIIKTYSIQDVYHLRGLDCCEFILRDCCSDTNSLYDYDRWTGLFMEESDD